MLRLIFRQLQAAWYQMGQLALEVLVLLLHKPLTDPQCNAQRLRLVVLLQALEEQRSQLLDVHFNDSLRRRLQHIDKCLQVMHTVVGQFPAHLSHNGVEELLFVQELDHRQIQLWVLGGNDVETQRSCRAQSRMLQQIRELKWEGIQFCPN